MARDWGGTRATRIRSAIAATLPAPCTKCGDQVQPGTPWDVDHLHARAAGGAVWDLTNLGPAHARCNRSAGATDGNHARSGRHRRFLR